MVDDGHLPVHASIIHDNQFISLYVPVNYLQLCSTLHPTVIFNKILQGSWVFFLKASPAFSSLHHTHPHTSIQILHVRQQKHKGKTPSKSQIHQKICCEHTKIIWNTMKVTIVLVNWWHFGMGWCRVDVERVAVLRVGRRALLWPVNYKICAVAPMKDVLKFISWKIFG